MFSNILVPVDGSEIGERSLPVAQGMAKSSGGTIHLVQVISREPELQAVHGGGAGSVQMLEIEQDAARRLIEARTTRGKNYLESLANRLQNEGVKVTTVMREGAADENIADYAREQGIDLIVMSTHGRGGFKRLILGSVTDRVIRSGETPVLVVPAS